MKREEKSAQARERILEAAMREFSARGYDGASLNTACQENGISKGIVYHHFKDKNALYLRCVQSCFDALTAYLKDALSASHRSMVEKLQDYFDARLRFFAQNPLYLGIFADVVFRPPADLGVQITSCRKDFDTLSLSVLTDLLRGAPLREGFTVESTVEEFRLYMDFFNMRFKTALNQGRPPEIVLKEHEERCHRQLDILLYGVMDQQHAK
jgi:TetR/AcrR family transcriptional regulator